jgi:hypothetical protein
MDGYGGGPYRNGLQGVGRGLIGARSIDAALILQARDPQGALFALVGPAG